MDTGTVRESLRNLAYSTKALFSNKKHTARESWRFTMETISRVASRKERSKEKGFRNKANPFTLELGTTINLFRNSSDKFIY